MPGAECSQHLSSSQPASVRLISCASCACQVSAVCSADSWLQAVGSPSPVTSTQQESSRCHCDDVAFIFLTGDPVGGKPPLSSSSPHPSSQDGTLSPRRGDQ